MEEDWKWRESRLAHYGIGMNGGILWSSFRPRHLDKDPKKLFNSSLERNTRRAIDLREGEKIDERPSGS